MKILILHLSDVHIKAKKATNTSLNRIEKVKNVVHKHDYDVSACFVVVSGDIVFSGNSEEYKVAMDFLVDLQNSIKSANDSIDVKCIVVPGNHDCDFDNDDEARRSLLDSVRKDMKFSKDYSIINNCTSIQKEFFDFLSLFCDIENFHDITRIHYQQRFPIGDYEICFNCFNTAWMSQLDEKQGQIVFPVDLVKTDKDKFDLVLSVFHHTYAWFELSNGKMFKNYIERNSDIILTGHEHDVGQRMQKRITGEINEYIEGGRLQDDNSENSDFNVLLIDLQEKEQKVVQYVWEGDIYCEKNSTKCLPFGRSKFLQKDQFRSNEEFRSHLNDAGAAFTHPQQGRLSLNDIFVYPDLRELDPKGKPSEISYSVIKGTDVIDYVTSNEGIVVIGAGKSGKTTLAKKICMELLDQGLAPILVNGKSIRVAKEEEYLKLIDKTFVEQYSESLLEKYRQLEKMKKVVLIDDFNKAKLNRKGEKILIDTLARFIGITVLFHDDTFQLEEIVKQKGGTAPFLRFKICEIMEFGHFLREKTIERWLTLGLELEVGENELTYKINKMGNAVNTILRKNLLPSYPIFILTILQTIEANIPLKTVLGSYGYFYEFLITKSLAQTSPKPSLGVKCTYVSELAYYVFSRNLSELTESDMDNVDQRYYEIYAIRIPREEMTRDLVKADILIKRDQSYRFRYPCTYYYFVARYMRDNIQVKENEATIKEHIRKMSKTIFQEAHANIIIFLSYLSKDPFIIEQMLKNAREIYKDYKLCDLEQDVDFLNKMPISVPKMVLEDKDVKKSREEYLRRKDEIDTAENDESSLSESEEEIGENELLKINTAFKTLDILGQVVRNFAGSLRAETKFSLTGECYFIGLRTLKFLLSLIEDNLDNFKKGFFHFLKEDGKTKNVKDLENKTGRFLFLLLQVLCYGIIKKISYSVGAEELEETYKRVLDKYNLKSVSLVDISIKLDHFPTIPMHEITRFYRQIENKVFLATLLRSLVVNHFYMFPVEYDKRQELCDKLDISVKNPKFIGRRLKKF